MIRILRLNVPSLIRQVHAYRLMRDLTYLELQAEMAECGIAISKRTLHHVLTAPTIVPRPLTVMKLRRFLETISRRPTVRKDIKRGVRLVTRNVAEVRP